MDIYEESRAVSAYVVKVRRHLHVNPEPSALEFNTIRYIATELDQMGISYTVVADGGILATITSGKKGKTIILRADCDALTMQEDADNLIGPKCCVSQVNGVAHTCGHDAHVSMLLGAAKILNGHRDEIEGNIILLFERGEEGGGNIYYIMKYIEKQKIKADGCFAIHVDNKLRTGEVAIPEGPTNAGNLSYDVVLTGKSGHSSRPDESNNPIDCFIAIGSAMKDLRMRYTSPMDPLTYSICVLHSGCKSNIIPETLNFAGGVRFYNIQAGKAFQSKLKETIILNAKLYDCEVEFKRFDGFSLPVINNPFIAALARKAVAGELGDNMVKPFDPTMGSESFSILSAYYPGAIARLGITNPQKGTGSSLHSGRFDIDEDALQNGVAAYAAFSLAFLENHEKIQFKPFEGNIDEMNAYTGHHAPQRHDK